MLRLGGKTSKTFMFQDIVMPGLNSAILPGFCSFKYFVFVSKLHIINSNYWSFHPFSLYSSILSFVNEILT